MEQFLRLVVDTRDTEMDKKYTCSQFGEVKKYLDGSVSQCVNVNKCHL